MGIRYSKGAGLGALGGLMLAGALMMLASGCHGTDGDTRGLYRHGRSDGRHHDRRDPPSTPGAEGYFATSAHENRWNGFRRFG